MLNETIAVKATQAALGAKKTSDSLAVVADANAQQAISEQKAAIKSAQAADSARKEATRADSLAQRAKRIAVAEKNKSDTLLQETLIQNRRIAASEYQKLIREGPVDADSINHGWNYNYYSYWDHLKNLQKDPGNKADVKNDELYDKLYYSLILGNYKNDVKGENKKFVMNDENDHPAPGYVPGKYSLGNGHEVTVSDDKLHVLYNNTGDSFPERISAISADTSDKLLLIATEDNVLTIEMLNKLYQRLNKYRIPMGGQVTALDYDPVSNVIFFGLMTGEMGYINFIKDSRNQPVYKNQLDSRITAIDFFTRSNGACYLLATSIRGRAVVYEIGEAPEKLMDFLKEDKKLAGIELPENVGDIRNAKYLSTENRIELITLKGTYYLWNPFVDELLTQLHTHLDPDVLANNWTKNKFYK